MNYFKNENNKIYAYDDKQVEAGYGANLIPITEAEKDAILAPTPEELAEQEYNQKWQLINEYLANDIPNFVNPSTGHEFIVKGSHIQDIKGEYFDWLDSDSFDWEQYGIPTFKTNKAELGIVISYVKEEKQKKIVEVFGLGV